MTKETIKIFINKKYSKGLKRNYVTKKTDFYHIDKVWSPHI